MPWGGYGGYYGGTYPVYTQTVVMPATQVDDETTIAMFVDPTGNTFGVYGPVG